MCHSSNQSLLTIANILHEPPLSPHGSKSQTAPPRPTALTPIFHLIFSFIYSISAQPVSVGIPRAPQTQHVQKSLSFHQTTPLHVLLTSVNGTLIPSLPGQEVEVILLFPEPPAQSHGLIIPPPNYRSHCPFPQPVLALFHFITYFSLSLSITILPNWKSASRFALSSPPFTESS